MPKGIVLVSDTDFTKSFPTREDADILTLVSKLAQGGAHGVSRACLRCKYTVLSKKYSGDLKNGCKLLHRKEAGSVMFENAGFETGSEHSPSKTEVAAY